MISRLKGKIIYTAIDYLIIDVKDVGYKVNTSKVQSKNGELFKIWTYEHTGSDNQRSLYGFATREELLLFESLLKVQGIGPKIAQKITESDSPSSIQKAILEKDITYFTRVKGLGKKGAQKILLELQNELIDLHQTNSKELETAKQALTSLGFTPKEITNALNKVSIKNLSDETAIEKLLQHLG